MGNELSTAGQESEVHFGKPHLQGLGKDFSKTPALNPLSNPPWRLVGFKVHANTDAKPS